MDGAPVCLGVWLAPAPDDVLHARWALTAKHCFQPAGAELPNEASQVTIATSETLLGVQDLVVLGGAYANLAELDDDLALLRVAGDLPEHPGLPIGDAHGVQHAFAVTQEEGNFVAVAVSPAVLEDRLIYTDGVTCTGDSGGPLVSQSAHAVIGVASWRTYDECGEGVSVFARVSPALSWIEQTRSGR